MRQVLTVIEFRNLVHMDFFYENFNNKKKRKEKKGEMFNPRANEASQDSQQPKQYVYYTSETHGFTSPDSFVVFFGPTSKGPTVP